MAEPVLNQDEINESTKELEDTYCGTAVIDDYACHGDRCHNTTTHIHDCDTYDGANCDNITTHFVICNSTDSCRNTTRRLDICYSDIGQNCGNVDFTIHCCTNGVCRNRTTHIHACDEFDAMNQSLNRAAASICASDDRVCNPFFPFDPLCVDSVLRGFRRRRHAISK